ncbi:MAG: hypothetical protein ACYSX0_05730 [Planctomycetota bacterium]|jgi:hypothetical protein
MLAAALLSLLVLGAPERSEAEKKLRIAWNSQYEWKEDGVKSVLLDFTFERSYRSPEGHWSKVSKGAGQLVVVDGEVIRTHLTRITGKERTQLAAEMGWVLRRFVRKPFDEAFKGVKLRGPEEAGGGAQRIKLRGKSYLIKNDRLIAEERNFGPPEDSEFARVSYEVGEMGGGYAILGTRVSFTRKDWSFRRKRSLKPRFVDGIPMPLSYTFSTDLPDDRRVRYQVEFDLPKLNAQHPVVLDPAARDLLKAAWERRYVLPDQIRIEGEYKRLLDKNLSRTQWIDKVPGPFQVWGMNQIEAEVEDDRFQSDDLHRSVARSCTGHFQWFFAHLRNRPFEKEFENCGFKRQEEKSGTIVIQIFGSPFVLAYRLRERSIIGVLENSPVADRWWEWKLKSMTEERDLIERMSREIQGKDYTLKFSYSRSKGHLVPKRFQVLEGGNVRNKGWVWGVVDYALKKIKVSLPADSTD